ncbi:MAG: pilus assembly protein [Proteobacteria bacterium]|nr:pilus assembly protein [Pseudomonadota bacterium]MBU1612280.1 pilus assembly protein [Pseudomonadota bacterium]
MIFRGAPGGMVAVETALILPVLLVLALGTIETGNILHAWLTVHKAAQTGARFASTGQGDDDGSRLALIELQVGQVMDRLEGGAATVNVSSWAGNVASGEGAQDSAGPPCGLVEVEVVYDYHPITPLTGDLFPEVVVLAGSDRKIIEPYKPCE